MKNFFVWAKDKPIFWVAVTLLISFFIPVQITTEKIFIGVSLLLYVPISRWFGIGALPACLFEWACLVFTAVIIYRIIKIYIYGKKVELRDEKFIFITGTAVAAVYFIIGIVCVITPSSSYKPFTLAFIPFLIIGIMTTNFYIKMYKNNSAIKLTVKAPSISDAVRHPEDDAGLEKIGIKSIKIAYLVIKISLILFGVIGIITGIVLIATSIEIGRWDVTVNGTLLGAGIGVLLGVPLLSILNWFIFKPIIGVLYDIKKLRYIISDKKYSDKNN